MDDNTVTHIGEDDTEVKVIHRLQPDWVNEPSLMELKTDLQEAQSDHDTEVTKIDGYLDALYIQNGEELAKSDTHSTTQPKLIRKQAEWRYAALTEPFLSTPDVFNVDPITFEDKLGAEQNELVLNNQFNTKIDKVKFFDDYVHTAVDEGTVIVRVGWDYQEEETELLVPGPDGTMVPTTQNVILRNCPTVEVCSYKNVVVDPTCEGDIEKAQFIIYSFETTKSDLEKAGIYTNLDAIVMESSISPLSDPDIHSPHYEHLSHRFTDEPRQKIVAYEYWGFWDIDGSGETQPIVATWVGNTMIRMEKNPFPDGELPFVITQYLPVRKKIYGEPDGILIYENQKNYGALMRGMIDSLARSANGQTGMRKDMLDITNRRKFNRGEDYEFNPSVDPRQGVIHHTYPELPASAFNLLQLQQQEAETLTGVRPYQDTQSSTSTIQPRNALDAASKRENNILRRLARGIEKIGRKIIAMNAIFLKDIEVVRVTNRQFVNVRRDDLAGNFDLRLSISTIEADNEKAQELAFMMQTMGNTVPLPFSQMVLAEIAKLRKMPALAEQIAQFQPPPPTPEEQMLQQMQLEELYLANEKTKAEIQEKYVQAMLGQAKTGHEQAKTEQVISETDLANQEFMDNQTGVAHARDVDVVQAQAEAQTKMKIIEAQLEVMKAKAMPKEATQSTTTKK